MTTGLALLPWHDAYWQSLQQYLLHKRVPQALLLSGNSGLGKHQLALQFADALLCEARLPNGFACGHCHGCLLQKAGTHPDFIAVQPEEPGKGLGIDVIRRLLPVLTLKPQFEGFRVVMINSAELLNMNAANAFLKCLEEPNERTVIILVSANAGRLPATIRSRCQQLKIASPSRAVATEWLMQQNVLTDHAILLNLAQGAPFLALQLARENSIALRNSCFDEWLGIARQQHNPVAIAERWQKLPSVPLLSWISSWVVDLIKRQYNVQGSHFYNPDLQTVLQDAQKPLNLKALFALYDVVLTTQKQIHTQLNKQLLIEVILIQWFNLNCRD
ncbi:MAG: DNA polymerase III subunit delta' [Methylococcales bacterium]|nr:DNA polymerase III subunit delta' [Methylococcales bacterium]